MRRGLAKQKRLYKSFELNILCPTTWRRVFGDHIAGNLFVSSLVCVTTRNVYFGHCYWRQLSRGHMLNKIILK